ncbi:hypothetical protein GCM10009753_37450 [Streptantibioticus ferralitis]
MHGKRVIGPVHQPGRYGDAALRRQHQVQFQFAFHDGVHEGDVLSSAAPGGVTQRVLRRGRTGRERILPTPLRDFGPKC